MIVTRALYDKAAEILQHPMGNRKTDPYLAHAAIRGHLGRIAHTHTPVPRTALGSLTDGVADLLVRAGKANKVVGAVEDWPGLGVRAAAARWLRTWRLYRSQQVDQNGYPACVGATVHHWRRSLPVYGKVEHGWWLSFYNVCKQLDGYAGDGTYVTTALEVCRRMGLIGPQEWWWTGVQDNAAADWWLLNKGGLWVGMNIPESMFRANPDGSVELVPPYVYGHEMFFIGTDRKRKRRWCPQTWGPSYGVRGRFYLTDEQWDELMVQGQGDAVGVEEIPAR